MHASTTLTAAIFPLISAVRWIALLAVLIVAPGGTAWSQAGAGATLYEVEEGELWIPMKDGVRLYASVFKPVNAPPGTKFPAVFKLDPYRNNDNPGMVYDCSYSKYFAAHGYVAACVDIRGTGRSEGHVPPREYSEQELSDGEEIIAWLATQPWSSGAVGVWGMSWSGFNGLRLAMRHPPALKAVISVESTEVLFNEDCHYTDGIPVIGDDYNFGIDSGNIRSRSPDFPIDEETLQNRFDNTPWTLLWLRHQRDGAFWQESHRPLDSIQVPLMLIGGFLDLYRDTIPRALSQVRSPIRTIVGPWNHAWPDSGTPGPSLDYAEMALRWWDQWLKGKDTGVMSEPKLSVYMRHWYPPDTTLRDTPGVWRAEDGWPPRDQKTQLLYLHPDHALKESTSTEGVHTLKYVPSIGAEAGSTWGDLTPDQRPVDAYSLVYDSAPLQTETTILGLPEVRLRASTTAPLADWFARLSDVAPDGQVTQITGGGLNGAQRESMSEPKDLEPGKVYSLRVPMHFTSWAFPVGHRIRLSISNAQWPLFWPTPYSMSTSLYLGGKEPSQLLLPTVPVTGPLPSLAAKSVPSRGEYSANNGPWRIVRALYDVSKPTIVEEKSRPSGKPRVHTWGTETRDSLHRFQVDDDHPELASYSGHYEFEFHLASSRLVTWRTDWDVHSDKTNFYYLLTRQLRENGKLIRKRKWQETIPRDHQ
jgi:predicted acyl esterase